MDKKEVSRRNDGGFFRKRTRAREYAVQMMYASEITGDCPADTAKVFWKSAEEDDESVRDFAENLFVSAYPKIEENDRLIETFISEKWSLDRVGLVEKCLLRVGVHELFEGDAPVYAVLDDYVTLAKSFGDDKSASFINGIMEKIRTSFEIERGNDKRKRSDNS